MQRRAAVHFPARLVHLVPGAVCQQQDDCPQVLVGGGPQQVLAQGQLGAWQWGQEELLLIFGPDPALLLLPARAIRQARSQSGGTTEAATPVFHHRVARRHQGGSGTAGDKRLHRAGEASGERLPCAAHSGPLAAASPPPGNLLEMQALRPLNQNHQGVLRNLQEILRA